MTKYNSAIELPPCDFWYVPEVEVEGTPWVHYSTSYTEAGEEYEIIHVIPENDLQKHRLCRECWCKPTVDEEEPFMLVHNSADERELFERGERKRS